MKSFWTRLRAAGPLVGLFTGILLAAAPLFAQVAWWTFGLLVAAGGLRVALLGRSAWLPPLALKVAIFGLSTVGIGLTYGSMVGAEPGISILLSLVALKVLETNGERDCQVLALLGYFLGLCDLFFSQDLLLWLYVGAVFAVVTALLVRLHRGTGTGNWKTAAGLMAQAIPLVVLLFFLFPRAYYGPRFQFSRSLLGTPGMSDRLSPGSVSSLAMNEDVAFRADFPDGNAPSTAQMYWRGGVLWRGDGMTWLPGPQLPLERRPGQLAGPSIRQRISLQPHGGRWLFALDRPADQIPRAEFMPGGYLQSTRLIFSPHHYEVVSRPENRETTLLPEQERIALSVPLNLSPEVRALVAGWQTPGGGGRELIERALRYFRAEKFTFTLNPGTYGEDALDDFLFRRRAGFCEHYAAAFATLMRIGGLPARVVIGYHGGETNQLGHYVTVRQSDAHAWTEVWLKSSGWLRVDPTEAIAPERIVSGLASYLESQATAGREGTAEPSSTALGWRETMREMRQAWDNVNYQWDLRVVNFDDETQRALLTSLGLGTTGWADLAFWTLAGAAIVLGALTLWLRWPRQAGGSAAERGYALFCARLARAGVHREPWEGPVHFGERAATQLKESATAIRQIVTLYIALRYGPEPGQEGEFLTTVRSLHHRQKKR